MNQKDYKAIAGILKESRVLKINDKTIDMISHRLADYFEKENLKEFEKAQKDGFEYHGENEDGHLYLRGEEKRRILLFIPQYFLNLCGVEE